jgi:hypothetical protein
MNRCKHQQQIKAAAAQVEGIEKQDEIKLHRRW